MSTLISSRSAPDRRRFLGLVAAGAFVGLGAGACRGAGGSSARNLNFAALAAHTGPPEVTSLRYQGSAGFVELPELAADLGFLGGLSLDWVGNTTSGPQDIQSAATGQTDFGNAFNGAIVKLAQAGAAITAVVNSSGISVQTADGLYVAEGSAIRAPRDLIGKTVAVNVRGAQYEAALDLYLRRAGLSTDEIAQVEPVVVPPTDVYESLVLGKVDSGFLSSVLQDLAVAKGGVRKLVDDYELLGDFNADAYVLSNGFIQQNPNATRLFVAGVAKALQWSATTPRDQVVSRMLAIIARRGRDESASAVKYFKSFGVAGAGGVIRATDFQTWIDWLVSQGTIPKGAVTAAQIYTNAFNPFAAAAGGGS